MTCVPFTAKSIHTKAQQSFVAPRANLFVQDLFRRRLHHKVAGGALQTVLMRVMINNRMIATEIVPRRGRWNAPFERCSLPRIRHGLFSAKSAIDQVEEENELRGACTKRRDGDEFV